MSAIIGSLIEPARVRRVLDMGCGAGLQVRKLAPIVPEAQLLGLDISPANVRAAEAARQGDPAAARMSFVQGDYLATAFADPFDLIVSDGVLHLIAASDEMLAQKLARDLVADGTLVVSMASDCLYNRGFALVRRALAAVRTRATDRAILQLARLLYRDMDEAMLSERVPYMYTPPTRLMGRAFGAALERHGLALVATHVMSSTSISQLTHAVYVFRRAGAVA